METVRLVPGRYLFFWYELGIDFCPLILRLLYSLQIEFVWGFEESPGMFFLTGWAVIFNGEKPMIYRAELLIREGINLPAGRAFTTVSFCRAAHRQIRVAMAASSRILSIGALS